MNHDFDLRDQICRRCGITTDEVEDNADLDFCFERERKCEQAVQKSFLDTKRKLSESVLAECFDPMSLLFLGIDGSSGSYVITSEEKKVSYDVSLTIDTGGADLLHIGDLNVTYNLAPMFAVALGKKGLRGLHDKSAMKCIKILRNGIAHMEDNPAEYRQLNPSSGWGNEDFALDFMRSALRLCLDNPKARFHVS